MFRIKKQRERIPTINLYDCQPQRAVDFIEEDGKVIVLRPRFMRGPFARFLQPLLPRPFFRVKLDEIGSFIWKQIDGGRSVRTIVAAAERHFGQKIEPAGQRVAKFLRELESGGMIKWWGRI